MVSDERDDDDLSAVRAELARLFDALHDNLDDRTEASRLEGRFEAEGVSRDDALASREVIAQAKGIIMTTMHCTADQALNLLVKLSRHKHRPLLSIAQEITDATVRAAPRGPAGQFRTTQEWDTHFDPPAR